MLAYRARCTMSEPIPASESSTRSTPVPAPDTQLRDLFTRLGAGDLEARATLLSTLYEQLKTIAHRELRRRGHDTMNTTGLVNEAYLKLFKNGNGDWEHRRQFLGTAAMAMRQLIVDHARSKSAQSRKANRVPLDDFIDMQTKGADILALDEALHRLAAIDEKLVRVVEMRFFAGYSIEDTARILHTSSRTVVRRWETASAWLFWQLKPE